MFRVTTGGNYSRVLSNSMLAQQRQMDAGDKLATQKNGSDLKDYSRNAEMLTAMRSVDSRLGGYLEQNKMITDKLTTQDFSLSQLGDAAASTKQAIEEAIATGRTHPDAGGRGAVPQFGFGDELALWREVPVRRRQDRC